MLDALIIPTERPITELELKRALLTFEHVDILSPEDRELVPSSTFQSAICPFPVPFGMDAGPVLPLGKTRNYDEQSEAVLKSASEAISQGIVRVRSTPEPAPGLFIGAMPSAADWPEPRWVIQHFIQFASRRDYLSASINHLADFDLLRKEDLAMLAPGGAALTTRFQDFGQPVMASLSVQACPEELQEAVHRLAAARLGAILKCVSLADMSGSHPFSSDPGVAKVLEELLNGSRTVVDVVDSSSGRDDAAYLRRVERVVFREEYTKSALEKLSVQDVLRLRTKAWGEEGEARKELLSRARLMAGDCKTDSEFEERVKAEIELYRKSRVELDAQRSTLGAKAAVAVATPAVAGLGGLIEQLTTLPHWASVVAFAAFSWRMTKDLVPDAVKYLTSARQLSSASSYALVRPFKDLI